MFTNQMQQPNTSYGPMPTQFAQNQNRNSQQPSLGPNQKQIYPQMIPPQQPQNIPQIPNSVPQPINQSQQQIRPNVISNRMIPQQEPLRSIRNQVQPFQQSPQKYMNIDNPLSIRNQNNLSPQGPASHKSNANHSGQKPAFVEYYPPVYVPHIEPMITQTVVDNPIKVVDLMKFEEMWMKRMQGIEELLATKQQPVEPETLELRAVQNDDSERVIELENELFRTKQLVEDRDKEIMDLKSQLQSAIEQLDFENQQSKNSAAMLISELQMKITNLQSTIVNIQLELKQSGQNLEKYKLENVQLRNDVQNYIMQCQIKDETILKLNQQLKQLNLDLQSNQNGSYTQVTELQIQITTYQQTISNLKNDLLLNAQLIEKLQRENGQLRLDIQNYIDKCNEKDDYIQKLEQELSELNQQVDQLSEEITTTQSVKTYEEEAKIWKKKFKELNDVYHSCQEKLMVKEAEYESLQKQQSSQKIVTQTTVVQQHSSRQVKNDSDYVSSSLTQNDIEKLQNLQKPLQL
ncbi:unnamed protein product [Paramecium pentaurelia]|uniref:Uncharacterized protein n=1 Tax=Paramecium pentaurelia TaxID=43138 RepID=A0A8S1SU78_9CILI|nr:unnamed protein product [Paramecium pentaurelia]